MITWYEYLVSTFTSSIKYCTTCFCRFHTASSSGVLFHYNNVIIHSYDFIIFNYGTAQRCHRTCSLLFCLLLEHHPLDSRHSSKITPCISSTESLESASWLIHRQLTQKLSFARWLDNCIINRTPVSYLPSNSEKPM